MKTQKGLIAFFYCLIFLILFSPTVKSQQSLTTINSWNAYVHIPDDYNTTSKTYPVIVFIAGIGEIGTDPSKLLTYGPSYFMSRGDSMNFRVNGVLEKPIVISMQPPTAWPNGATINKQLDSIVKRWRINPDRIYLTGLSMGGWSFDNYITTDASYALRPAAMVIMSAPESNMPLSNYTWFGLAGGKWWGFEGSTDYRKMDLIKDLLNLTSLGSAKYTAYNGGHCCWNTWYDPRWKDTDNESIYTWMLKQKKNSILAPQEVPIANAGNDKIITLPTNSVTLNGSGSYDPDGSITAYQWNKIAGPSQFTIATPAQVQTTVSNLVQGAYQFELIVTDNQGATAKDTVAITVNAAVPPPNRVPVANAGIDQSIILPISSVTLNGSSSSDPDGSITAYQWNKIAGPSQFTIATPAQVQTTVSNLVQGAYQFELIVTDNQGATAKDTVAITVNAAVPPPNRVPVANAGIDQSITLPISSVTLNGSSSSDPDGSITAYQWNKIAGPSQFTIATPAQVQTTVSNLVQGAYQFELIVTDNQGATAKDTVAITVAPVATNCNTTNPKVYTLSANAAGEIYIPDASSRGWKGGDTIRITSGNYELIDLGNFAGDACRPIVIINYNGLVTTKKMRLRNDASYFKLTGTGVSGITYGFKTGIQTDVGLAIDLAHDVEISNVEVTNSQVGFYFKKNPDAANPISYYPNYVSKNFYIHNNYIHDVHGEGMYIGDTYPNGDPYYGNLIPVRFDNVEIANNIVDGTDWDGIQLSNARTNAKIHHNTVTNFGRINMGSQQAGIILGGNTTGDIYDNTISNGTGNGIEAFGYGTIKIFNNTVENVGADGTVTGQESILCNDPLSTVEINPKQQAFLYNNIIKNPRSKGATKIGAYNNNSLVGQISNNQYCIPNAPNNWQALYIIYPVGTQISGNSLMSNCAVSAPNQTPTARAGNDQVITLPINSVTVSGAASTDPDGIIASYSWAKIAGPTQSTIATATQAQTTISNLAQGIYQFELTVADNLGATNKDTVIITVNAAIPPPNQTPTARAGNDQVITLPTNSVTVSGAASTDPDGIIASYSWAKIAGPTQSTIATATQAQTTISNLAQGTYQFELTVADNLGATNKDTVIITVNAAIPPPNQTPTARAGNDQVITLPTNSVTVSGAASTDPDGIIASYSWAKIAGPTQFTIATATQAQTTISNLAQGTYQFELTVADNLGATNKDTVIITVNAAIPPPNQTPTARAGNDQVITLPINSVTVSGAASTDPDGIIASYSWAKIAGPTQFTIATATQAQTTISNLAQGTYQFELTVADNLGATNKDTVIITVNAAIPPPNQTPTARAGNDQVITLPTNSVTVSGAASTDPDGIIASYSWAKIAGPTQFTIATATQAQTTISNLAQGTYQFELTVADNLGATNKDTVIITVNAAIPPPNQAPTARAGKDEILILPLSQILLDGSYSFDQDGTIVSYKWTKIQGPSSFNLVTPDLVSTTIKDLVEGIYIIELEITDNNGSSSKDSLKLTVINPKHSLGIIYPNPVKTTTNLTINAEVKNNPTTLVIYDVTGSPLYTESFIRTQSYMVKQLYLSKFLPGVYIYEVVIDKNKKIVGKFIKE